MWSTLFPVFFPYNTQYSAHGQDATNDMDVSQIRQILYGTLKHDTDHMNDY